MAEHGKIFSTKFQDNIERNTLLMFLVSAVAVAVGGLVEIVPLFYLPDTMENNKHPEILWQRTATQTLDDWKPGDGVRPYKPLELAGRDVYIQNGCYLCHSQMIRPFRDEKDRYGHYSLATESIYDHPFQWGSKRTGPDLARVGGKYSDEWQRRHLRYPRSVVPESVMPNFFWLENKPVDGDDIAKSMKVMRMMPFNPAPYTDADIAGAKAAVEGKNQLDAVIAYLQALGSQVKFQEGIEYRDTGER
jgi:cytochrome c oxidase cbb3-type subunit 2